MQTNKTFSISEALKFGWETFKKKPFFWIVASFLVGGGSSYSGNYGMEEEGSFTNPLAQFDPATATAIVIVVVVLAIIIILVSLALEMGAYKAAIQAVDNVEPKWGILVSEFNWDRVLRYFALLFRLGLIILGGILLLIIPGIYWALMYMFAPYIYIEKNVSISEAFRLSKIATEGVKWKLFGFGLVIGLMLFVGALLFIVGLFVAMPVALLAGVYVYKKLASDVIAQADSSVKPAFQADTVRA